MPNVLRTESGAPVADNQNSQTAGPRGPVLLQDQHLLEKLARFNRERIPERVVHAVGSGAHGFFEVTNPDVARWTRMRMLDRVGKRTPVFFLRDPLKFPDFIHSQKHDPYTNEQEPENVWDFFSWSPEATHQFTWLFGDHGVPATLRHMDGFGSHTFQWLNAAGERFWVKFHFKTDQGIRCLTSEESARVCGENPQHHQQDLRTAIERGEHPSWTLKVQVMPDADAATYRFDPFDVTKVWPYADYPLIEVGRLVLDRNPDNYFAEVEQAAFDPGHFVPGVGPSPDKMLQGRLFAYGDAHRYRLGVNHTRLPINAPRGVAEGAANYGRDGAMQFGPNGGRAKNYEPNGFDGPKQTGAPLYSALETGGVSGAFTQARHAEDDDFAQAGALFRLMGAEERARLVANIAGSLACVSRNDIVERAIGHFRNADSAYGAAIEAAVKELRART